MTAAGKAILAFLPETWLKKYFGKVSLTRFTDKTNTSMTVIQKELESVRINNYATNRGEYEREVMAVAAPIFSAGNVQGSLVVQFPTFRYKESDLDKHGPTLITAAKKIGQRFDREVAPAFDAG